jgi:hypothetical protein
MLRAFYRGVKGKNVKNKNDKGKTWFWYVRFKICLIHVELLYVSCYSLFPVIYTDVILRKSAGNFLSGPGFGGIMGLWDYGILWTLVGWESG